MHVLVGIAPEHIVALAEGLNRSLQVNDKSLENLEGTFESIKKTMAGKKGANEIAYRQGDDVDVDIMYVLQLMGCFNLSAYDRRKHPNDLFGQSKRLLQEFADDAAQGSKIYGKVVERLPEILVLSEKIQQAAYDKRGASLSKRKVSNSKKGNRAGSGKYRRPAIFADGEIRWKCFDGWLFPMVAAFRACLSHDEWNKGKFAWIVDPLDILDNVIEELVDHVMATHDDYRDKPAEVGRKPTAYQLCHSAVQMYLAQIGKLEQDTTPRATAAN